MVNQESKYIICIAIIGYNVKNTCCRLIISCSRRFYKGTREKMQASFFCLRIIFFLVNKNNKVITKSINFLLAIFKGTT